ncbi:hypothetical protein KIN20_003655 [Parelaphostrongylus tenuis]|uniref:Uncharacterized protein n=1 Tax=Parelaphostrongylus tenuis TaxID=148309 RepID=A0AAD5MFX8_PARTN|nr:hypothetical protein KIN20_003655 [Parelaphostrongylus tenuis]
MTGADFCSTSIPRLIAQAHLTNTHMFMDRLFNACPNSVHVMESSISPPFILMRRI